MNATWNSEPLFSAFASSEDDDDTIVTTAEEGIAVIHADSADCDEAGISDAQTIELGNILRFNPAVTVEVQERTDARHGLDKSQRWLIRELDGLVAARKCVSSHNWDALPKMPVARAMAQREAGTPLFLAA